MASVSSYASQAGNLGAPVVAAPRTITSAIGKIENLNERLTEARKHLANLSDQIGGPRPTSAGESGGNPAAEGVVGRLNDATEYAHQQMADIESLLGSIGRALG